MNLTFQATLNEMIRKDDNHHQKSKHTGAVNFGDSKQVRTPDLSLCLWLWSLEYQMMARQARCSGMSRQEGVVLCWLGWAPGASCYWLWLREGGGRSGCAEGTLIPRNIHVVPLSSSKLKLVDTHGLEIPGEAAGRALGHCHVVEGGERSVGFLLVTSRQMTRAS